MRRAIGIRCVTQAPGAVNISSDAACPCRWFDVVYVLNLDRRQDRWEWISGQLRHTGISQHCVQRVAAVEGAKLDAAALYRNGFLSKLGLLRCQRPESHRIWGMDLNAGALGCAMSHVRMWTRIAAMDNGNNTSPFAGSEKAVLVVEDDSVFPDDFLPRLDNRMGHVPSSWQLVYVSGLDTAGKAAALQVAPGVSRVPQLHRTTNCYLLKPSGARSLLQQCLPFTYQLDTQMTLNTDVCSRSGEMYSVTPPCAFTLQPPIVVQATRFGSDIQDMSGREEASLVAEEHQRLRSADIRQTEP